MPTETNIFLYVTDAEASARFYSKLLEAEPVAAQPGFAMFLLPGGIALGLWEQRNRAARAGGRIGRGRDRPSRSRTPAPWIALTPNGRPGARQSPFRRPTSASVETSWRSIPTGIACASTRLPRASESGKPPPQTDFLP